MKRIVVIVIAVLGIALSAGRSEASWGYLGYSGYQPWWNIFAKRYKCLTPEEERLQKFWHDYYDALECFYKALDHIDWVAYYKNHGYQINCGPGCAQGCCGRINYAPVFVTPTLQWAVPSSCAGGPPVGPGAPVGPVGGVPYGPGPGDPMPYGPGPGAPMPHGPVGYGGGYPAGFAGAPAGYGGYPGGFASGNPNAMGYPSNGMAGPGYPGGDPSGGYAGGYPVAGYPASGSPTTMPTGPAGTPSSPPSSAPSPTSSSPVATPMPGAN